MEQLPKTLILPPNETDDRPTDDEDANRTQLLEAPAPVTPETALWSRYKQVETALRKLEAQRLVRSLTAEEEAVATELNRVLSALAGQLGTDRLPIESSDTTYQAQ